jgi:hypothetical protein
MDQATQQAEIQGSGIQHDGHIDLLVRFDRLGVAIVSLNTSFRAI